jgi:hypothetical protein
MLRLSREHDSLKFAFLRPDAFISLRPHALVMLRLSREHDSLKDEIGDQREDEHYAPVEGVPASLLRY